MRAFAETSRRVGGGISSASCAANGVDAAASSPRCTTESWSAAMRTVVRRGARTAKPASSGSSDDAKRRSNQLLGVVLIADFFRREGSLAASLLDMPSLVLDIIPRCLR